MQADFVQAVLTDADLRGTDLRGTSLKEALLRRAYFDKKSRLEGVELDGAKLYSVVFEGTDLAVVPWDRVRTLGDETSAVDAPSFETAGKAYRSLSLALREQGETSPAARFLYRAQVMQRKRWFFAGRARLPWSPPLSAPYPVRMPIGCAAAFGRCAVLFVLGVVAGYGIYHIWRLFLTYAALVAGFAVLYLLIGSHALQVAGFWDALVFSVTSFHGRGLQPATSVNNAVRFVAGCEAVVGLFVEALFIAAFVRRITGD